MTGYYAAALLVFVILAACLLIRYVYLTVDREFRNLARAASDPEYRGGEIARVDGLLAGELPIPSDAPPLARPATGARKALPPLLLAAGVIFLWGAVADREERSPWLAAGLAATLAASFIMLATLRKRKRERTARLLRFRADLRRMDDDRAASAGDLRQLLRLTPWDDAAWAELAEDLAESGDVSGGLDAMRQAVRVDPCYDEYRMQETSLALRLGRPGAAKEALQSWENVSRDEPDPRVAVYRAALLLAEGNRDGAARLMSGLAKDDAELCEDVIEADSALAGLKGLAPSAFGRQ